MHSDFSLSFEIICSRLFPLFIISFLEHISHILTALKRFVNLRARARVRARARRHRSTRYDEIGVSHFFTALFRFSQNIKRKHHNINHINKISQIDSFSIYISWRLSTSLKLTKILNHSFLTVFAIDQKLNNVCKSIAISRRLLSALRQTFSR